MRMTLLLSLAALAAAPAWAAPASDDDVSIPVDMRDLDLSDASHRARLDGRIIRAAGNACRAPDTRAAPAHAIFTRCKTAAVAGARAKAEVAIAAATRKSSDTVRLAGR